MRNDFDPIREEAMKTNQSGGRGYDFSSSETYPPVPWGRIIVGTIVVLGFLALACAISSVGVNA